MAEHEKQGGKSIPVSQPSFQALFELKLRTPLYGAHFWAKNPNEVPPCCDLISVGATVNTHHDGAAEHPAGADVSDGKESAGPASVGKVPSQKEQRHAEVEHSGNSLTSKHFNFEKELVQCKALMSGTLL